MKTILVYLLTGYFLFSFSFNTYAQNPGDRIIGKWNTEENKSVIEIYKKGDKYCGKIIWMKNPNENGQPKLDKENPDENLRSRTILNLEIMTNLEFDEDNEWEDGDIYDPESGNTYSCMITLTTPDKIDMRGYLGFSLFGRTTVWTRKKE
ncbi:MAG: DUF2147 domain-containing protein [Bacteroidales bacterium]|nr:DUF2147 domain-containing protein [Bacteroidales bacterium]MCF8457229.1 DUF2147 domain-containing protein [Bacteroidales bacterium]